jgi:hypothetical protein
VPRRGAISDSAYHGMSPEDQSKYAAVRRPGDQGGSEWVARSELEAGPANPADPTGPAVEGQQKYSIGRYEVTEQQIGDMLARQAAEDLRRATVPAVAEAYEAKLPENFKMPAGVEYKFDVNDPSLIAARNLAHAKGWSQQDFSEALGIFAGHVAGQEAMMQERARAEIAKVGVNAPQRVDAVGRFITAQMGEADGKQIRALIVTDSILRFMEKAMTNFSTQGTASFDNRHRDRGPAEGMVSDETWSTMTPAQKLDYTRNFDQRQFQKGASR